MRICGAASLANPASIELNPHHQANAIVNLLRAAATVSTWTLVSRILGLAREVILARGFGAGADMDAFNVAFRLPNLLRRLFAEGAFSQAFVPIFSETHAREGDARTKVLLSNVSSALFWVLLAVSLAGIVGAPLLVWAIATGFVGQSAKFALATELTRWMFPYILFISLVSCAAGALNTYHRYAIPAATPVLLNAAMIAAALLIAPRLEQPVLALALAVLVGGVAQLALQLPALARIGLLPRLNTPLAALRDDGVRRVLRLMLPALFAVSVSQLSLIINTNIASHLVTGSVSWITYADRLMEFPTALLGVALGTVLLPNLTRANAESRREDYSRLLDWGLRLTCVLALPAAVGLALLGEGIIATLYQGGKFTAMDVARTAPALAGYAFGLLGLIAVKILAPGYYAQQDIKTPVKIALLVLVATQLANLMLVPWLAHVALTVSVSLGALANAALLLAGLLRRRVYKPLAGWASFLLKVAVALAVMAAPMAWLAPRIEWTTLAPAPRAEILAVTLAAAIGLYFGTLWVLGFRATDFRVRAK